MSSRHDRGITCIIFLLHMHNPLHCLQICYLQKFSHQNEKYCYIAIWPAIFLLQPELCKSFHTYPNNDSPSGVND